MATLPKIQISKFQDFLKSKELITVGSAVLFTPILLGTITSVVSRVPFLRDNIAIGLAIAAFAIFLLSATIGGILRNVMMGVAAGTLITAIQTTSFGQSILSKLGGLGN